MYSSVVGDWCKWKSTELLKLWSAHYIRVRVRVILITITTWNLWSLIDMRITYIFTELIHDAVNSTYQNNTKIGLILILRDIALINVLYSIRYILYQKLQIHIIIFYSNYDKWPTFPPIVDRENTIVKV